VLICILLAWFSNPTTLIKQRVCCRACSFVKHFQKKNL
jgi:hypothetical protein